MDARDQWMLAVEARLERVRTTQDLGPVLEEGAVREALKLRRSLTDDLDSLPGNYLLGWLHWYRYQALPEGEDQQELRIAIGMFALCFIGGISDLPEPLLPFLADMAISPAARMLQVTQQSADQGLLSTTIDLWHRILINAAPDHRDRNGILSNLGTALRTRFERTGDQSDLDAAITHLSEAVEVTPDGHADRPALISNLGAALLTRFDRTGIPADLDAAITHLHEAVHASPVNHSDRFLYLTNLGTAVLERFRLAAAQEDIDAAITYFSDANQTAPANYPNRAVTLSNLGAALRMRFERTGAAEDLDAAIQAGQQAVQATPASHPYRARHLSNFGIALQARFERTGAKTDLDAAIEISQQAVRATPRDHPQRAGRASALGTALRARFERTDNQTDLDSAITHLYEAVHTAPADHPDRAVYLTNLGTARRVRFERIGDLADLDFSITYLSEAVQASFVNDPHHGAYQANLADALLARSERTGDQADLETAIQAGQQAVQATPAGRPDRAGYLFRLANALLARFGRTGVQADLETGITHFSDAVRATPAGHPNRAAILSSFGNALQARFSQIGDHADLDSAITYLNEAVRATPTDHPGRAARWSNLGIALQVRFEHAGALADLDAAIQDGQQAVQATPADHPDRAGRLSNLGIALLMRFERTGSANDLDAAIQAAQQAVLATPADDYHRARHLGGLGNALLTRFTRTAGQADLDTAIIHLHEALQATPADHLERPGFLSNLGNALRTRFEHSGAADDLDAAIQRGQQAVDATPVDHPSRARYLSNLGGALAMRFDRIRTATDKDNAIDRLAEAASVQVAPASARVSAARAAATLAAGTDPVRAAALLETAVLLLPQVTPRFLERGDAQYAIGSFAGLAADAAALALSNPAVPERQRPAQALRLLEAARGILLSQALSTRGNLSGLREDHPEIAARFTELRDWLDAPSPAATVELTDPTVGSGGGALQRAIRDRRRAAEQLNELMTEIRSLEGFASFALPPSEAQLEAQAEHGPVVVLNISRYRSDAIMITNDGITSQPLPGLDPAGVIGQINIFHQAIDIIAVDASPLARARAQKTVRQVLSWLWDNAAEPVLRALGHHEGPPAEGPWSRLWCVPGGLLALLPIHAAGHHANPPDPRHRTVMDRVISSYTPTVGALTYARITRPALSPGATPKSLIVAMPTTPDLPGDARLEYVSAEASIIQGLIPNPTILSEPSAAGEVQIGELPTKTAVLEHLSGCAIAHFACHGSSDATDPSQSRLLLHDHRREPFTVAALAPVSLRHAQLAYLSACNTARVTDASLLDEAIHLASAFQLAGFPHVVGTLWEINDLIAVKIAETFYKALTGPSGTLEPSRAAWALHEATRTLRDRQPANPYLWASHIHVGA